MSTRNEIREFLISRRAKVSPQDAGLPAYGARRRVEGLRREDVALLAGISVEYYIQVERGQVRGVSDDVLEAITRALGLDETERAHLLDLVHAAKARPARRRPTPEKVRPGVQRLLDAMTEAAAFVRNGRLDILTANRLGYALYSDAFVEPARPVNLARFVFLDARSRVFYRNWDRIADDGVGSLRAQAGRDPDDRDLSDLVGELSTRSDEFRSAGPPTTYAPTGPAPSCSTIPSPVTSTSPTRRSSSPPTSARPLSPTPPSPARLPSRPSSTLPAPTATRRHGRPDQAAAAQRPFPASSSGNGGSAHARLRPVTET